MKWGWYNGGFAKKNKFPIAPFVHYASKCEETSQIASTMKGDIVFLKSCLLSQKNPLVLWMS